VADLGRALRLSPDDATVVSALAECQAAAAQSGVDVAGAEAEPFETPAPPPAAAAALPFGGGFPGAVPDMDAIGSMSDAQLAEMNASMPAGMPKLTPELAKAAGAMMKGMSPETLQKMMDMSSKFASSMGAGADGGGAKPAELLASLTKDPAAMRAMSDMMASLPAEELARTMESATGMKLKPEDIQSMQGAVAGMSPETLAKIAYVVGALGSAAVKLKAARDWARNNSTLVWAMLALFVAWMIERWIARRFAAPIAVGAPAAAPAPPEGDDPWAQSD
jgi:hypothetical protein